MTHVGRFTRRSGRPLVLSAACVLVATASGCSSSVPTSHNSPTASPRSVVLVGDSLAEEAAPYLQRLLGGKAFVPQFFAGTAPCDWLGKDLQATETSIVVISFTGNSRTPCMSDGAGGYLHGQALVDKYRADIGALIAEARSAGAHALLVGQPTRASVVAGNDEVQGINHVYTDLADASGISFVDAGAAVETADGSYAERLACLPGEAECAASGSNDMRNDDGLHFCPGPPTPGPCPVYSSGAFRFASAIAVAVNAL